MDTIPQCKGEMHGHSFVGEYTNAYCLSCGIYQTVLSKPKPIKVKVEAIKPNKRIHTKEQDLVDQIVTTFNEKKLFGRWCGIVKRYGFQKVHEKFNYVIKEVKPKNGGAYLMAVLKNT